MLRIKRNTIVRLLLGTCILTGVALSQESDKPLKQENPSVEKISEGVFQIGSVRLDKNENEIYVRGEVNIRRGGIEYLACAREGKLHESVLVLDVKPYEVQVALLLLGLEPGGNLEYQGDPRQPQGDSVEVWVEWEEKGEKKKYRGEDLVYNIIAKRQMEHTPWVFTGSKMVKGQFMANIERSLIATYHDPFAIIDNPLPTGADDTLYRVNEELVPEKGTSITVIITPFTSKNKN